MMERRRLVFVTILMLSVMIACLTVLATSSAQAGVTGKQIPTIPGEDWIIDIDTTVDNETISLSGNLTIAPGYSLTMKDTVLTIESTVPGEYGIMVDKDTEAGHLLLERSTVQAEQSDSGWTFTILGEATLRSTELIGVIDGLRIFGDPVKIEGCEIKATGTHGMYIDGASPNVTNTRIEVSVGASSCGIEIRGSSADPSKPHLRDLVVQVSANTSMDISSSSSTFVFSLVGLKANGADLGTLVDIEIILSEEIVAKLTNAGTPRFNLYFQAVGIQLEGSTSVTGFNDVSVRSGRNNADVNYIGSNSATLTTWNSIVGLSNNINSEGESPDDVSGIVIADHYITTSLAGSFSKHTHYLTGYAIVWEPSILASDGEELRFTNLTFDNIEVKRVLKVDDHWNMTIADCFVSGCSMVDGFLKVDSWTHDIEISAITFEGNVVEDTNSGLIYTKKMSGGLNLTMNDFSDNYLGRVLYMDAPMGYLWITNNTFEGNNHSRPLLCLEALGVLAHNPLLIEGNTFTNNSCPGNQQGLVVAEYPKQNVTVNNNIFNNNTGYGIMVMTPYSDFGTFPHPDFWFTIEDNQFADMQSPPIYFLNVDNSNIVVRRNTATGGARHALGVDMGTVYLKVSKHWGSFRMYAQGPDSLLVEGNDFSNNPGGGIFLRTSKYDPGNPERSGNPYQSVVVRNNNLSYNGPDGWALHIMGLYNKPNVVGNDMDGSYDGLSMALIEDEAKRLFFFMTFDGLSMDGGDNGRTALRFDGIGATLSNCSFVHYELAVEVYSMAEVNILWSDIAMGRCLANEGTITVYNHLELAVYWSDVADVDSNVPIDGAAVSLTTNDGLPIRAMTTDENGRTPVTTIKVWEIANSLYQPHSPIKVAIACNGELIESWLHLSKESTGPNAARMTLIDHHVPTLTISSPQQRSVLPSSSILLKGVLSDFGSGIEVFDGRHDAMAPDTWVPVTRETLWSHLFSGLDDGLHEFTFRAVDVAGNINQTKIELTVDTGVPQFVVEPALLDGTEIPFNEGLGSYIVSQRTVLILGTYEDDVATLEEIVIRLDGKVITALGGQLGKINIRVDLDEGTNLLLFDAANLAGNRVTVKLKIVLDHSPPIMYVYSPLEGTETKHATISITGLTEPSMHLVFQVESVLGTRVYDHIETIDGPVPILANEDGSFSYEVELFEGSQVLLISAEDLTGNVREVTITIVLDTESPEFDLTSPTSLETITNELTWTITGSMTKDFDATILVNGQRIENLGTFIHEVVLHEGVNEIEVLAIDSVGNTFREVRTIIKDTVPPILTLTSPEGDDIYIKKTSVEFIGHVTGVSSQLGGKAGVFIIQGGQERTANLVTGTWDDGVWDFILELGPEDLDQEITVKAMDEAGNEVQRIIRVRYDVIPPSLSLDGVPEVMKSPILTINGSTEASISTVWVQEIPYATDNGLFSVPWFLTKGQNSITIEVRDDAGNVKKEIITVMLEWKTPGPETEEGTEDEGPRTAYAIAFLVAGLTVLIIGIYMAPKLGRRDAR